MIPINPVTVGLFAAFIYAIFRKGGDKGAKHRKNGRDRPDRDSPNGTTSNGSGHHRTGRVKNKGGARSGNLHENKPDVSANSSGNDLRGEPNGTRGDGQTTGLATVKEVDEL